KGRRMTGPDYSTPPPIIGRIFGRTVRDTPPKSKHLEVPKFLGFLEQTVDYFVGRNTVRFGAVAEHQPVPQGCTRNCPNLVQVSHRLSAKSSQTLGRKYESPAPPRSGTKAHIVLHRRDGLRLFRAR